MFLTLPIHSVEITEYSVTQILREIKVGESATFKHWEDLNFDFNSFLHFLKAEIYQIEKKWQF